MGIPVLHLKRLVRFNYFSLQKMSQECRIKYRSEEIVRQCIIKIFFQLRRSNMLVAKIIDSVFFNSVEAACQAL